MGTGKETNPNKVGIAKFWGWQARAISMGSYIILLGYLQIYCTDTLMLPAATVGLLLLVSKIFDGVTDLVAGYLIDNTKTKLGKARPYEFCLIGLWLCTWLLFTASPEWSTVVKCVWVFVMYTFVNSVFATMLYANQTTYLLHAFPNQMQMVKVNSYGGIVITIGCAVVSVSFPQLMATMATSASGWSRLIGMFAIPLFFIGMLRFLLVKETVEIDSDQDSRIKFGDILEVLKKNKFIYAVAGISGIYNFVLGMNAYTYYFTYIGGGIDRYSTLAAISMPLLIVMFIFPMIMKKGVPVSRIIGFGAICGAIGYTMNFIAGDNMVILILAGVLYTFAGLPIAYLSGLMILDCAEYNVLTGEKRMESTLTAVSSFMTKVGNGLGLAALGIILGAFGYDGAASQQTETAILGIRLCFSLIPAVMYLLIGIIAFVYKLDKVLPQLREKKQA